MYTKDHGVGFWYFAKYFQFNIDFPTFVNRSYYVIVKLNIFNASQFGNDPNNEIYLYNRIKHTSEAQNNDSVFSFSINSGFNPDFEFNVNNSLIAQKKFLDILNW